ncbi:AEC family transporter [Acinetobacter sp. 194]|uniref:AEC family transporter n=1 Tax=Acinetobacter shaoyimingii TaxID=2715164 RepID=UPI00140A7A0F|nr:AEC family transporter [Acinetobacter shaoyimingii]NHB58990.1 AEC family transporter [Acinetobacter shaoyimingii]
MDQILAINLPIFLMIAVGFISIKARLLPMSAIPILSQFIIKISLPSFLVYALSTTPLQKIWQTTYFLGYALTSISVFCLGYFYFRKARSLPAEKASIFAFGSSMSNTGFIGTAVLTMILGSHAIPYLAMTLIIESIIMLSLMLFLAEMGRHQDLRLTALFKTTIQSLIKHPVIQSIVVGCVLSLISIQWPKPIETTLNFFAHTATPLALFVIGGSLSTLNIASIGKNILSMCSFKMLLMPLTMALVFFCLPNTTSEMYFAALILATLPMASATAIYGQNYGVAEQASAAVMLTALLSFLSISAVLLLRPLF